MTIDLKPEQQGLVGRAIEAGVIHNASEVVDLGIEAIRERLARRGAIPEARDLVELFANSPFAGLDMDFVRDKDPGRGVEL